MTEDLPKRLHEHNFKSLSLGQKEELIGKLFIPNLSKLSLMLSQEKNGYFILFHQN